MYIYGTHDSSDINCSIHDIHQSRVLTACGACNFPKYEGAQIELVHQDKPCHGARHIVGDLVTVSGAMNIYNPMFEVYIYIYICI